MAQTRKLAVPKQYAFSVKEKTSKKSIQSDKYAEAKTICVDTETVPSSGESFDALAIGCLI